MPRSQPHEMISQPCWFRIGNQSRIFAFPAFWNVREHQHVFARWAQHSANGEVVWCGKMGTVVELVAWCVWGIGVILIVMVRFGECSEFGGSECSLHDWLVDFFFDTRTITHIHTQSAACANLSRTQSITHQLSSILNDLESTQASRTHQIFTQFRTQTLTHQLTQSHHTIQVQQELIENMQQKLQNFAEVREELSNLRTINQQLTAKISNFSVKTKSSPNDPSIDDLRALLKLFQSDLDRSARETAAAVRERDEMRVQWQEMADDIGNIRMEVSSLRSQYKSKMQGVIIVVCDVWLWCVVVMCDVWFQKSLFDHLWTTNPIITTPLSSTHSRSSKNTHLNLTSLKSMRSTPNTTQLFVREHWRMFWRFEMMRCCVERCANGCDILDHRWLWCDCDVIVIVMCDCDVIVMWLELCDISRMFKNWNPHTTPNYPSSSHHTTQQWHPHSFRQFWNSRSNANCSLSIPTLCSGSTNQKFLESTRQILGIFEQLCMEVVWIECVIWCVVWNEISCREFSRSGGWKPVMKRCDCVIVWLCDCDCGDVIKFNWIFFSPSDACRQRKAQSHTHKRHSVSWLDGSRTFQPNRQRHTASRTKSAARSTHTKCGMSSGDWCDVWCGDVWFACVVWPLATDQSSRKGLKSKPQPHTITQSHNHDHSVENILCSLNLNQITALTSHYNTTNQQITSQLLDSRQELSRLSTALEKQQLHTKCGMLRVCAVMCRDMWELRQLKRMFSNWRIVTVSEDEIEWSCDE